MTRKALVVGISTYTHLPRLNLETFSNNAEAIAQKLQHDCNFEVTRLPEIKGTESEPIVVGKRTPVTRVKLERAIKDLFLPQDNFPPTTALLYFAGHGTSKTEGFPGGYLVTSDADFKQNWGLSLKELRELLQDSNITEQIVWLDSCYSSKLFNLQEAEPGEGNNGSRCFIAASTNLAYANNQGNYGVFTQALLKGLNPANYSSGEITNLSLSDFVSQEIKKSKFPQTPVFSNFGTAIKLIEASKPEGDDGNDSTEIPINCPYQGLEYFTEENHAYFFGRTQLTSQLLDRVRQSNFLAILGASGSGKSSLLRAGLLYELKQGKRLSGSESWQYYLMQPGDKPLQNLALAFVYPNLSNVERATEIEQAEKQIKKGADGLRRLVQAHDTERVVLLIDQFEEVFTLCQDKSEREQFFQCLLEAIDVTDNKLCVIIAMRADFFGKCVEAEYSGLAKQIQTNLVSVTPMTEQELKLAITEPAKKVKLNLEPELITEIIKDVKNAPGSLPLMQDTLRELWRNDIDPKEDNNYLRLNTYSQLGRVAGTLQQRATEVYDEFSREQQEIARHIFLSLTQLGEGTEDTRRRVLKQDLVTSRYSTKLTQVDEVIQTLANQKLIVTRNQATTNHELSQESVVDVAHEALILNWDQLRQWLDENRDYLRQKRKLKSAAQDWLKSDKNESYLLQGVRLSEAEGYFCNPAQLQMLDKVAEEFLQASQNLQLRLKQEAEQRKQQELADLEARRKLEEKARIQAEKAQKEAENRAREQVEANKKLRQRAWGLGISSITIVIFGLTMTISILSFYLQQKNEASSLVKRTTDLIANSIEKDLEMHLQNAWQANNKFYSLIRSDILDPNNTNDKEKIKQYFIDSVRYKQILKPEDLNERGFFWGDTEGKTIGVIYNKKYESSSEVKKTKVWMSITQAEYEYKKSQGEKIKPECQQDISFYNNNVVEIYNIDQSSNIEHDTFTRYDPRKRLWYIEAKETQKWSTIYPFCQSQDFGMSAIVQVYDEENKFLGVLASDVRLLEISEKLKEATQKVTAKRDVGINSIFKFLQISPSQSKFEVEAFVIDEENKLVAFSSLSSKENNKNFSTNKKRWSGLSIKDNNLRNLYDKAREKIYSESPKEEEPSSIEFNKQRYFIQKQILGELQELDWDILVVVPANQYINNTYTIYVEVLLKLLIIFIVFGFMLFLILFILFDRKAIKSKVNNKNS